MRSCLGFRIKLSFGLLFSETLIHVNFVSLLFYKRNWFLLRFLNWSVHVNFIGFIFSLFICSWVRISRSSWFCSITILKSTFGHWDRFILWFDLGMSQTFMIFDHWIWAYWFLIICLRRSEHGSFWFFIWELSANFTVHHKVSVKFSVNKNWRIF